MSNNYVIPPKSTSFLRGVCFNTESSYSLNSFSSFELTNTSIICLHVSLQAQLKTPAPQKESYDKARQCIKKQRHHLADKGLYSQSCSFSSSHIQRDITLQTKVYIVKAVVFLVVTYRYKSWTKIKLSTEELIISNCGAEEDS